MHMWSRTYLFLEEAVNACDTAAWRFGQSRECINIIDIQSRAEAKFLAPLPLL
jgi:hypothetical protein